MRQAVRLGACADDDGCARAEKNLSAIARPMPLVPPVTMTTLPSKVEPTGCGALLMS
jgi:hypothetical protein